VTQRRSMPWVKSSVAVAARRPSDPDISELSLTSFRSIRSPQAFLPASVIPHPRDFDDACPLGLIRRRGFRRAEIPPVGAADDPCRMDCTPGTASPPRRSRTHARRPTEDRRASRTPTRCRGSRELSLPCWHFPAVEYPGMGEWPPNDAACRLWALFDEAASEPR
jgi:hypothetical protein